MTPFHLILIALLAALGIAVKAVIAPLVQILTSSLFIPGGVVAGGIYMLFIVLACSLTGKLGAATLCGLVQGIMVLILGTGGSHGALSVFSYTATAMSIDILMVLLRKKNNAAAPSKDAPIIPSTAQAMMAPKHHTGCCLLCCFLAGMVANLTGTLIVNAAFFSMPLIPMLLPLFAAALSGGFGGILAWGITKKLRRSSELS
ncbi:MAG: ECF transporter S component [Oscillospiraceae bacterium]|nr:ECF transporter S component [Oscillospiraceae bacterium]